MLGSTADTFCVSLRGLLDKGVDMPVAMLDSLVQTVLGQVMDVPVVVQRQVRGLTVQNAVLVPQLPFVAGRRHPSCGAEADSHGFPFSEDQRDSAVAVCFLVVDAPVVLSLWSLTSLSWPSCRFPWSGYHRVSQVAVF